MTSINLNLNALKLKTFLKFFQSVKQVLSDPTQLLSSLLKNRVNLKNFA